MGTPTTDWKERIDEGEDARLEALAQKLVEIQRARKKNGTALRGLHAKGHAGVRATLEVRADLPEHARQGLFATPGRREALVRFSNGAGEIQSDRTGDVRGMAIKVLGVPGAKIIPGLEGASTQDFLVIAAPSTPFRGPEEFVDFVVAAAGGPLLLLPRFAAKVGLGRAFGIVRSLLGGLGVPFPTFAGQRMWSALPIRFGPYAVRYALLSLGDAGEPTGQTSLADDLRVRLGRGPLAWDLAVQFFVDEARTPIEDASVDWKESDSPFLPLARLELPRQDLASEEGRALAARIESLSFDPWHALPEHRPLGRMMRARSHAYRLSTAERGAEPEP